MFVRGPDAASPVQDWLDLSFDEASFEEMFVSEKPLMEIPEAREWRRQLAGSLKAQSPIEFADVCHLLKPEFAAGELERFLLAVHGLCCASSPRLAHLPTLYLFAAVSLGRAKVRLCTVQEDLREASLRSPG